MVVLVTGATGFVGRRLVARLRESGHELRVLTRNPGNARRLLEGCELFEWPDVALPPDAAAFAGVQAVIHLAGENVAGFWTRAKRARIRASRVLGTKALVAGLARSNPRPRVLVSASAIGYYGDRGDELLREPSHSTPDFLAQVCQDWEGEALRAREHGVEVVIPRIGIVLGKGGGALAAMELPYRLGVGGPLGAGRQWWSWIDVEDLVSLLMFALQEPPATVGRAKAQTGPDPMPEADVSAGPGPMSEVDVSVGPDPMSGSRRGSGADTRAGAGGVLCGIFNAVAPHPVRQREFAAALGKQLGRPSFMPAPAPLLRAVVGGFSWELLSSKRVDARKVLDAGFVFRSPRLADALSRIYP